MVAIDKQEIYRFAIESTSYPFKEFGTVRNRTIPQARY